MGWRGASAAAGQRRQVLAQTGQTGPGAGAHEEPGGLHTVLIDRVLQLQG